MEQKRYRLSSFLSKRVCSSHSGVLSLGDVTCKKNPDPLVGQSASSCWVAKKKEKIDSISTVATKLPSFLLCRSSSVPTEWLYALSWPFTSSRIKLVTLITKKNKSTARHLTLLKSLTAGSSGSFVSVYSHQSVSQVWCCEVIFLANHSSAS